MNVEMMPAGENEKKMEEEEMKKNLDEKKISYNWDKVPRPWIASAPKETPARISKTLTKCLWRLCITLGI